MPVSSILPAGLPGCLLLTSPDVLTLLPVTSGIARQHLAIPVSPGLVGQSHFQRVLRIDLSAAGNFTSLVGSNGLSLTIGAY